MSAIINVSITVDSDKQIKDIHELNNSDAYFDIFDERYKKGKKDAWALKNQYGAQLNPFIEIKVNGKFYQMIYSEAVSEPIKELEKDLKNIKKISNTLNS